MNVQAFRERYRAKVSRYYHALLHIGFVFGLGVGYLIYLSMQLNHILWWHGFALPVGLIGFNFLIYFIHRDLGHVKRRWASLFYRRHTGDHHSFFSDVDYCFEQMQDFRVILFPPALIVIVCLLGGLFIYLNPLFDANFNRLLVIAVVFGYLLYEFFHTCHHLPDHYVITQWPWIKHMRQWHRLHHNKQLTDKNFNLVVPLADYVMNTRAKRILNQ